MEYIEKTLDLRDFQDIFENDIDIFLFCKQREERGDFNNKIKNKNIESLYFTIDYDQLNEEIVFYNIFNEKFEKYSISESEDNDITNFFNKYLNSSSKIVIDMTDMDVKILAIILRFLKYLYIEKVFVMYTEPEKYLTSKVNLTIGEKDDELKDFNFNQSYLGVDAIPYYLHNDIDYANKEQLWIVFLGFDRNRTKILYDSKNEPKKVIPVITLPSARPGWDKYAYKANFDFLYNQNITEEISYVSYSSPFETYNFLKNKVNFYSEHHIIISPLGTKPNTLGAILYVLENKYTELLYDNPFIKRARSTGVLKTFVFDISDYLR